MCNTKYDWYGILKSQKHFSKQIKLKNPHRRCERDFISFSVSFNKTCLLIWNKKGDARSRLPFPFQTIILTQTMFYYIRGSGSVRNLYIVYSWSSFHILDMEYIASFFNSNIHFVYFHSTSICN